MEKNKKNNKKRLWTAGFIGVFLIGAIGAMLIMTQVGNVIPANEKVRSWHVEAEWTPWNPVYAEASPGAGASGILEIYMVNHSTDGNLSENTTGTVEGWCDANDLGYASADDTEVDLSHSVDFDIGIKVRANKTHAWRDTKFFDTDVRVRITSADLDLSADTVLSYVVLDNDTVDDYIWLMFETKADDGAGFSIPKDTTYEITSIKFECYY